jgi:hypothetical protein
MRMLGQTVLKFEHSGKPKAIVCQIGQWLPTGGAVAARFNAINAMPSA